MVKDQQEAEKKKVQSQEIQQQLRMQTVAINEKRDDVMADLAQVEPAVIDAQNGTYLAEYSLPHRNIDFFTYIFQADGLIVKFFEENFTHASNYNNHYIPLVCTLCIIRVVCIHFEEKIIFNELLINIK